jgi:hypothetical protein
MYLTFSSFIFGIEVSMAFGQALSITYVIQPIDRWKSITSPCLEPLPTPPQAVFFLATQNCAK